MRDDVSPSIQSLCICADDFGLSFGINAAVFDLAAQGIVTATGCLVQRRAWAEGARQLRRFGRRQLDTGLHLDLTPPRTPDGPEPGLAALLWKTHARTADRAALRHAIADQLSRFEDDMGRAPDFVDGHRHVHQLPVVRELLLQELHRRYGASSTGPLPWLRSTRPSASSREVSVKAHVIHALGGAALAREATRHGLPMSRALLGVYDFGGSVHEHRRRVEAWLSAARTGDVLMCHPSFGDCDGTPHDAARVTEHKVLSALRFPWTGPSGHGVVTSTLEREAERSGSEPRSGSGSDAWVRASQG